MIWSKAISHIRHGDALIKKLIEQSEVIDYQCYWSHLYSVHCLIDHLEKMELFFLSIDQFGWRLRRALCIVSVFPEILRFS